MGRVQDEFGEESVECGEAALEVVAGYGAVGGEEAEVYAESYLNEAIAAFSAAVGPDHPSTLKAQVQEESEGTIVEGGEDGVGGAGEGDGAGG